MANSGDTTNKTEPPQSGRTLVDRSFTGVTSLVKLLTTCTVLLFQALSPSFSNRGHCYTSNYYLTWALVILCSVSCFALSFTDSALRSDGALHFGVATCCGFYFFGGQGGGTITSKEDKDLRRRLRMRSVDWVHAFFSALLFLTLAFTDSNVIRCLFLARATALPDAKQLLKYSNDIFLVSSFMFLVFPTSVPKIGVFCRIFGFQ